MIDSLSHTALMEWRRSGLVRGRERACECEVEGACESKSDANVVDLGAVEEEVVRGRDDDVSVSDAAR